MTIAPEALPDEPAALKRIIAAMAQDAVNAQAEIAKLKFQLARYRRAEFGRSSEKLAREAELLELALYRQAEIYAREGVILETSTLSGWVGATAAHLKPLSMRSPPK